MGRAGNIPTKGASAHQCGPHCWATPLRWPMPISERSSLRLRAGSLEFPTRLPDLGKLRLKLAPVEIGRSRGHLGPHRANFGPNSNNVGATSTEPDSLRPDSTKLRATSARLGAKSQRISAGVDRFRPTSAKLGPAAAAFGLRSTASRCSLVASSMRLWASWGGGTRHTPKR